MEALGRYKCFMGSVLVIASAFGFATLGIFGKLAFQAGFSRNSALLIRFLLALPVMALLLWRARSKRPSLKMVFVSVGVGAVGIGVEASLFFFTLQRLGAALTGIFLYLYPAFVALISHIFLSERLSLKKAIFVGVALFGSVLTAGVFGGVEAGSVSPLSDPIGLIAGVLTGAWYAIYILVGSRVTRDEDPLWVSTGVVAGSFLTFLVLSGVDFLRGSPGMGPFTPSAGVALVGLAIFSTVLPFATLYAGMKKIGAVRASLLSTLELVFTLILACLFLDEKLTVEQWFGSVLILVSVLLTARHG